MTTKTIRSTAFGGDPFDVRRTGRNERFFDYYTWRTYTRRLWVDCIGEPYVWLNGRFLSLSVCTRTKKGLPFTINEYAEC